MRCSLTSSRRPAPFGASTQEGRDGLSEAETTGDLARFPEHADLVISIDPIDGTKQYRDKTGNGYAVMLHLRSKDTVHYSLVFVPEKGEHGWCDGFEEHFNPLEESRDEWVFDLWVQLKEPGSQGSARS